MRQARTKGTTPTNPALNVYRKKSGGLMVSAHVPDVSGKQTECSNPPWHGEGRGGPTFMAGRFPGRG